MSSSSTTEPGLITTADIGRRLDHSPIVSSFIVEVLKVPPHSTNMRAKYWTEEQFQLICSRLAEHAARVAERYRKD